MDQEMMCGTNHLCELKNRALDLQFRRVSHSDVMSFAVASFFTCDVFAVGSVYAYTCLFDVLGASTRTTFSATTKPCDRVPPSAHQAQRRLHWACPVGLCDACCAGWVGGVFAQVCTFDMVSYDWLLCLVVGDCNNTWV